MDTEHDYLMPTCMLNRRRKANAGQGFQTPKMNFQVNFDHLFDDTLRVLESDACSEISDRSYADASYYTRMKQGHSVFVERWLQPEASKYKPPWERNRQSSEFDKSLQMFLEWPESEENVDTDVDDARHDSGFITDLNPNFHNSSVSSMMDYHENLRPQRKVESRRRRNTGGKGKTLVVRRAYLEAQESDSDHFPVSDDDDDASINRNNSGRERSLYEADDSDGACNKRITYNTSKIRTEDENTRILRHNLIKPPPAPQIVVSKNVGPDSDSDYKTLSDTSCDRIENSFTSGRTCSVKDELLKSDSLKLIMASVAKRSENIVRKITEYEAVKELINLGNGNMKLDSHSSPLLPPHSVSSLYNTVAVI